MKELIEKIKQASYAYYQLDKPIMTDKEYDDLCDELASLENDTGVILAGSPNHHVQGYLLDGFAKVQHSKPMLSAAKTKDINEIKKFLKRHDWYCSGKLDGVTLVTIYNDGKFVQGITRGDGITGEDVTDACRFIKNLPMQIPYKDRLELRGECVMSWNEFNRINENLVEKYSHPRNLAAGTLRQLDLDVVKSRELSFVVFECVTKLRDSKWEELKILADYGFETVTREMSVTVLDDNVDSVAKDMTNMVKEDGYPYDGLIFEINSHYESDKMGKTDHHENCRMALKWADDLVETTLRDVEWSLSKTGMINPVAVFDEVDLGGALTSRATLHNLTYIKELELGIGDTIQVYRANLVIPKVHDNLTRSNNVVIPKKCPICGGLTKIVKDNDTEVLYCTNDNCAGRTLGLWQTFVSKKCMNIDGLSEQTLEKLLSLGYINNMFATIYELNQYKKEIAQLDGFGPRSVTNLLRAIEASKNVDLQHFITAFSIPGVGPGQAKVLAKKFKTFIGFAHACDDQYDFTKIDGIGEIIRHNINQWWINNHMQMLDVAQIVHFKEEEFMNPPTGNFPLLDKTFVITGKVYHYKNRDELKSEIESLGGKVAGSVSKNTDYLINNDTASTSGKNKKAQELGVQIISEENYIDMIKS